jgi:acetoin utilization deacetylase AcuC-like enzyme
MPLHAWSSAKYTFPLPDGHRFPIAKYSLLRERVLAEGIVPPDAMHDPARVSRDDLLLVHTADYVDRFTGGRLNADEERRLGFPWSESLVERSYRAAGGTSEAARYAVTHGIAMNLAGGTHHAFPDHGEGFCVFNDVAIAIRALQRDRAIERALVVDLDVHQGNGTHAVFAGDDRVFTFSMHGDRNYPFRKVAGSLDIDLHDRMGDDEYLNLLVNALPAAVARSHADLVVYLAGADPHENDRLGRLSLTFDGLARRDSFVIEQCREVGLPVVVTIAGGYGKWIDESVQVHVNTARIAARYS